MHDLIKLAFVVIVNVIAIVFFCDNLFSLLVIMLIESILIFKTKSIRFLWQHIYPMFVIVRTMFFIDEYSVLFASGIEFFIILSYLSNKYFLGVNTCYVIGGASERLNNYYQILLFSLPYMRLLTPLFYIMSVDIDIKAITLIGVCLIPLSLAFYVYRTLGQWSEPNAVDDFVSTYDPEVIMYVCGVQGGNYQLEQWLKTLEKLHRRVLIVARETFWLESASKTKLPIAYAKRMIDVERLISPRTKVCLYPANGVKNAHMMRRTELKHIFINHGESDKIVNTSKFLNAYDMWYLAGKMAKERMENAGFNLNNNNYRLIGRPPLSLKIDNVFTEPDMVLYAPTWEGFDDNACYSSIVSHGRNLIADLIRNEIPFIFKPHPLTGHVKKEFKKELFVLENMVKKSDNGTLAKEDDILDLMNRSSFLVTDISSVMNDYLQTGKPFFVTNPSAMAIEDFNREFKTTQAAYIYETGHEFSTILQKVATFDSMSKVRKEVKESSLGPDTPTAFEIFSSCIEEEF